MRGSLFCRHRGKIYVSGARIEDECNSCICEGGVLSCSSGIKETCFRSNGGEVITQFDGEVEGGCKVRAV